MKDEKLIFLVADDDEDEHYLIRNAILDVDKAALIHSVFTGFELFEFLFNKGAYENQETQMPHAIIADINMPILNGFDVIKTVKETAQLNDIIVYILTTSTRDEDRVKALALGADGYFIKPGNFTDLKNIMTEIYSKIKR